MDRPPLRNAEPKVTANEDTERRLQFLHLFATAFTRDGSELSEFAFQSVLRRTLTKTDRFIACGSTRFCTSFLRPSVACKWFWKISMEGTDHGFFSNTFLLLIDAQEEEKSSHNSRYLSRVLNPEPYNTKCSWQRSSARTWRPIISIYLKYLFSFSFLHTPFLPSTKELSSTPGITLSAIKYAQWILYAPNALIPEKLPQG